jgi:hypothetical protein
MLAELSVASLCGSPQEFVRHPGFVGFLRSGNQSGGCVDRRQGDSLSNVSGPSNKSYGSQLPAGIAAPAGSRMVTRGLIFSGLEASGLLADGEEGGTSGEHVPVC